MLERAKVIAEIKNAEVSERIYQNNTTTVKNILSLLNETDAKKVKNSVIEGQLLM